jgi:transposase
VPGAASRTKGTYLRAKYESMIGRKGKKKALLIVGHKILCAVFHILKNKEDYKGFDVETFGRKKATKANSLFTKRIKTVRCSHLTR